MGLHAVFPSLMKCCSARLAKAAKPLRKRLHDYRHASAGGQAEIGSSDGFQNAGF
jgi:hypothetical protein